MLMAMNVGASARVRSRFPFPCDAAEPRSAARGYGTGSRHAPRSPRSRQDLKSAASLVPRLQFHETLFSASRSTGRPVEQLEPFPLIAQSGGASG